MAIPKNVKWWIPGVGLVATTILVTPGFAATVESATESNVEAALDIAGIDGVTAAADYRDVTLAGPAELEDAALETAADVDLVSRARYLVEEPTDPQPEPSPSPSITPSPSPSPTPSIEPTPEPTETELTFEEERDIAIADVDAAVADATGVRFGFDTDAVTTRRAELDVLAETIVVALDFEPSLVIRIAGHTDSRGSRAYNQKLSVARAEAVAQYLIDRGVPATALNPVGYGESRPIASNATDAGKATNRRVELSREDG